MAARSDSAGAAIDALALGPLSPQALQRQFAAVYGPGLKLFRAARTTVDDLSASGVYGRVWDDLPEPFTTRLEWREAHGEPLLHNACSCDRGADCEHVVALALAWHAVAASAPVLERASPAPGRAIEPIASAPNRWLAWLNSAQREVQGTLELASSPPAMTSPPTPPESAAAIVWLFALERPHALLRPMLLSRAPPAAPAIDAAFDLDDDALIEAHTGRDTLDRLALLALRGCARLPRQHNQWFVIDAQPDALLHALIASGRLYLEQYGRAPITSGQPRALVLDYTVHPDGSQELGPALPDLTVFGDTWQWWLDPANGEIGRLDPGPLAGRVALLRAAPLIEPEWLADAQAALDAAGFAGLLPAPRALKLVTRRADPRAILTLDRPFDDPGVNADLPQGLVAMLEFRYGERLIPANDERAEIRRLDRDQVLEFSRDGTFEAACAQVLLHLGLVPSASAGESPSGIAAHWRKSIALGEHAARRWVDALQTQAALARIDVYASAEFPFFIGPALPAPEFELRDAGDGWFEARLEVVVDDARVDLWPLLDGFRRQLPGAARGLIVTLADGRTALLPRARLTPMLRLFDDLVLRAGVPGISRERALSLQIPEDWRYQPAPALALLLRDLDAADLLLPLAPPPGFAAELRPYQATGLAWLDWLNRHGLGGVLADDMGLGKTVQLLALLAREKHAGRLRAPALVVCPTSVVPNWLAEAARFAPQLALSALGRGDRSEALADLGNVDLVITSYALLLRDIDTLAAQRFSVLILDEAQWLKNQSSQGYKAALRIDAALKIAATGTPIENHLGELKSLFDLVLPGLLGTDRQFQQEFRIAIERDGDSDAADALKRRIAPFLLRRTKAAVATELPPRTIMTRSIELGEAQRALYERTRDALAREVDEMVARQASNSGLGVLDALLKLRQICCDPALLRSSDADPTAAPIGSAKREALLELLVPLLDEGRSVLLFSQFTRMLDLIEADLRARHIDFSRLDGSTPDRAAPVERFQNGEVPLMLVSLKAGGTGLNLTRADTVILYDPWWNPAAEAQAIDRAHRIGQDKPVFVYELIARNTVEERIQMLKQRKREVADSVITAAQEPLGQLNAAQLLALLAR